MICKRLRARVSAALIISLMAASVSAQQEDWRPLYDGESLDGWQQVGPGKFVIENGLLKSQGGMGLLWYTQEKFANVEIKVQFRNPGGKTRVFLFASQSRLTNLGCR